MERALPSRSDGFLSRTRRFRTFQTTTHTRTRISCRLAGEWSSKTILVRERWMVQQPGSPSDSMLNLSFADVVRCGVVRSCRALTQRSQPGEVYRAPVLHQQGCRDNDRAPERPRKREGPRPGRQVAGAAMVGRDFHHLHRADDDPLSQKYAPGTVPLLLLPGVRTRARFP